MWVMTTRGFYSVVQHRDDPTKVMIRARCREDVDAIAALIPDAEPFQTDYSDYAWRIVTSASNWIGALTTIALAVDYDNFKNAVKSPKHKNAYLDVWSTMLRLDDRYASWGKDDELGLEGYDPDDLGEADQVTLPITLVTPEPKEHDKTAAPFFDPPEAAA